MLLSTGPRAVNLLRSAPLSIAGGAGGPSVEFSFLAAGAVDLGAVGRALGLDPATVLINGHYLSRGPDFVSTVTWGALLSFFSARGFSLDPIAVQGRPLPLPGNGEFSFKRKLRLEDETPSKKVRATVCIPATLDVRDRRASSHESLCIKRTLELEGSSPSKRQNTASCDLETRDFRRQIATDATRDFRRQIATDVPSSAIKDRQESSDGRLCIKRTLELKNWSPSKKQNAAGCCSVMPDFKDLTTIENRSSVMKRILEVEDRTQFKKQNTATYFSEPQVSSDSSICITRTLDMEGSNTLKKQITDSNNSRMRDDADLRATKGDNDSHCSKRKTELEDGSSEKKQKIYECNPVAIRNSELSYNCISGRSIVILKRAPFLAISNDEGEPVSLMVDWPGGVDLGAIGRALRLDPVTVRLNGHFLSYGADFVSSVTWNSVKLFFSSRRFPTGDSVQNAIVVQGKPLFLTALPRSTSYGIRSSHEEGVPAAAASFADDAVSQSFFNQDGRRRRRGSLKKKAENMIVLYKDPFKIVVRDAKTASDEDKLWIQSAQSLGGNIQCKKRKTVYVQKDYREIVI